MFDVQSVHYPGQAEFHTKFHTSVQGWPDSYDDFQVALSMMIPDLVLDSIFIGQRFIVFCFSRFAPFSWAKLAAIKRHFRREIEAGNGFGREHQEVAGQPYAD